MGNQISRHEDPIADGREGVMPEVTFTEVRPGRFRATLVRAIPTWMQDEPDLRLLDIPRVLASGSATARQQQEANAARARIVDFLDAYGALSDGLVVP
jgi:poly-gamma-glutamate synthesis protein (capsule biosynthesis protein)